MLRVGDNLPLLRAHVADNSVDLIYLDPPFNSAADYSLSKSAALAFSDVWRFDEAAAATLVRLIDHAPGDNAGSGGLADRESSGAVAAFMRGIHAMLGPSPMLAYLCMIVPRLLELRRVMKPSATLYLHCDPTASHYLKLALDAVLGPENFRNEIIWCYAGGGIPRRDFPRKHDVILRYTRSSDYTFNPVYRPYSPGTRQRGRTAVKGKYFAAGLRPEGTPINDWWTDVPKITSPTDPEKLGYPTQKPEALLQRIITASSNPGDLVLDPFCGSGTTLLAAARLNRRYIGFDLSPHAIELAERRLRKTHAEGRGTEA